MSQTLTPTPDVRDGAGLNLTALLATPTSTTLLFANTGKERLLVSAGAVSETVTVDIGVTILGQAVSNFPTVNLTNGDLYEFGPYDTEVDQPGGTVEVTLSTITSIMVALLQGVGTN